MIIDTHTHIGKLLNFNMTSEQLLYSMEKYGIDFSLVSNIEGAEYGHNGEPVPKKLQKSQNDVLKSTLKFARENPDKIGALAWIKTAHEVINDEFIQLLEENADIVYGLKLHPFHSRTAPDSERLKPVYQLAERFGLPVVSHTGGCEEADSLHLYNAAKKYPDINFVMVHMDLGTDNKKAVELLGKLPNLYADTTWVPIETTLEVVKRWGSGKIMFGTDNPIDGANTLLHNKKGERSLYQQYFNELKGMLSEADYDNIMYKNAERLFGIKR